MSCHEQEKRSFFSSTPRTFPVAKVIHRAVRKVPAGWQAGEINMYVSAQSQIDIISSERRVVFFLNEPPSCIASNAFGTIEPDRT